MATTMVTPEAVREQVAGVYRRRHGRWAVRAALDEVACSRPDSSQLLHDDLSAFDLTFDDAAISLPLHPPNEKFTVHHMAEVAAWVTSWRAIEAKHPDVRITWVRRQWASIGMQEVPNRIAMTGPETIAYFVGETRNWRRAVLRCAALMSTLDQAGHPLHAEAAARLARRVPRIVALSDDDAHRFVAVVRWLVKNPDSELFIRQLPIRGVHTKWLEQHRGLVTAILEPLLGRVGLGLREKTAATRTVRIRILDPALAPDGLQDVAAPVEVLARWQVTPRAVVAVENLETLLSLEPTDGVIAVWGSGYAYENLAALPWVRSSRILYWGDIDSHGLNILAGLRHTLPQVESLLMDPATLRDHLDLAVPEPTPHRSKIKGLTPDEEMTLALLRDHGDVRLEQERLPWSMCAQALRAALTS